MPSLVPYTFKSSIVPFVSTPIITWYTYYEQLHLELNCVTDVLKTMSGHENSTLPIAGQVVLDAWQVVLDAWQVVLDAWQVVLDAWQVVLDAGQVNIVKSVIYHFLFHYILW